ncbi:MAG: adenylosuccinate lyase [bacterium]|nr:adenylosuccinate lyase [bacterium]
MIERYSIPEIREVFKEENKYKKWVEIELTHLKVLEEEGVIPPGSYEEVAEKVKDIDFAEFAKRAKEIEKEVDHDVIAFLMALEEKVGEKGRYLHYGLTSSDVVDTANALVLKEAIEKLITELDGFIEEVKKKAVEYKYLPIMGRTHGVFAEPTSLGLKFLYFYSELLRAKNRLELALREISVGKISGAVGNYVYLSPEIEEKILKRLNLKPEKVSTQIVPRDRHAFMMSQLAILASSLERFATEIRLLQRTEVNEIMEPFGKGQRGSSAMPHKRNPIKSERICGLARLLRGYLIPALENIPLWHERDISHSSNERYIFEDAICTLFYVIRLMKGIIEGIVVNREKIEENLRKYGDFYYSQALLLALVRKGFPRKDAYEIIKRVSHRSFDEGVSLKEMVLSDAELGKIFTPKEIDEIFKTNFLRNVDEVYKRFGL